MNIPRLCNIDIFHPDIFLDIIHKYCKKNNLSPTPFALKHIIKYCDISEIKTFAEFFLDDVKKSGKTNNFSDKYYELCQDIAKKNIKFIQFFEGYNSFKSA